jgi:hypothetical protein
MVATTTPTSVPRLLALAELLDAKAVLRTEAWRADAECRGEDPELFVIDRGQATSPALEFCKRCTVRVDCVAHAMDAGQHAGRGPAQGACAW